MKVCCLFIICFSFSSFSQDDLSELFDESSAENELRIGTDLIRIIYGTPNIFLEGVMRDKYSAHIELGSPFFGYKEDFIEFEQDVVNGVQYNLGGGLYFFNGEGSKGLYDFSWYAGFEFEGWDYNTTNQKVARSHGFRLDDGFLGTDFIYSLEANNNMQFKRKIRRFGLDLGANYWITKHVSVMFSMNFGLSLNRIKFDKEQSYGVTWISEEPTNWVAGYIGGSSFYGRFGLTLKYNLL